MNSLLLLAVLLLIIKSPFFKKFTVKIIFKYIEDTFSVGITKSIPFEFNHPYDITEEFTEQSSWKRRLFRRSSGPIYFKGPKWFNPKVWRIRANAESTKIIGVTKEIAINIETDSNPDMMK